MLTLLLLFLGVFAVFALLDLVHQARTYPDVRHWRLQGMLALAAYLGIAFTAPMLWDAWLAEHRLLNLAGLPFAAQVVIGVLALEGGIYFWHRTLHGSDFLWRHSHQTHHAAERVDVWGAYWFHPLDMLGWTLVGSLSLVGLVGLGAEAAITVNLATFFLATLQHANISTPHWLGWFVARPEMHAVHHQRGVHRYNYSDLPLFDMLFGTYRNPRTAPREAGFHKGSSQAFWPLLIGRPIA